MDPRERLTSFVRALPVGQRVVIGVAAVVLVLVAVPFASWVSSPSYTVLYADLDDAQVAEVIAELESSGTPYRLEAGGSRVLVPRADLYRTRAELASAGVATGSGSGTGYELLDGQGLGVSDFRQRVDYQRALEGELARTLQAMDGIEAATVRLVLPEDEPFAETQEPATASVLLSTRRDLGTDEVEAVTFLVASAVEGLETDAITVADSRGTVLHAPGDAGVAGVGNRQLRQTREFEQVLGADISALLERATGSPAAVVVRATLDFDQTETQTETYAPDSQVVLRERTSAESYEGIAPAVGGTVGVDGRPAASEDGSGSYAKDDASRDFGVDRVTTRSIRAPGRIERLSVAIVVDDGSQTGATIPADPELETLVAAAVGLEAERGDEIAVTRVAYVPLEAAEEPAAPMGGVLDLLPTLLGALLLLVIAIGMVRLTRRGQTVAAVEHVATVRDTPVPSPVQAAPSQALRDVGLASEPTVRDDVVALVENQPEEIAALLRGWLSDRRSA